VISVVVPNLNEERYLRKFLLSLCTQSYPFFEVIVVDGGSTDRSLEILDEFKHKLALRVLTDKTPNIGHVRNTGSFFACGDLLLHTSSDVILDPWILQEINYHFLHDHGLVALTGRTKPISGQILCHIAYQGFDLLRWAFSKLPGSLRKYRPGGNFFAIKKWFFIELGGFPEVAINEDGLLGQKVDQQLLNPQFHLGLKVKFDLGLYVHHHVKRFEEKGSIKTILFYLYVFGNLFPMLKPMLYKIEAHSAEIFKKRSDLRNFSGRK